MSAAVADEELFDGGPPLGTLKALGLVRPAERHTAHRALIATIIGWMPLAVLATAEELAYPGGTARSFFTDVAVHARFLIALPLFVLAEADAIQRFGQIACHFLSAGFVQEKDRERYADVVGSTRRLLDSRAAALAALALAYALVFLLLSSLRAVDVPAWHWAGGRSSRSLSMAGWWHWLVSIPLLLLLLWGWLWRLLLWWRFLALMARLELRLVPAHPDRAGGLKFVSESIRGYRLLAFAIGAIVAGTEMNLTLKAGQPPLDFKNAAIGVAVFVAALGAGPLLVFFANLQGLKRRGILEYGALGREVGAEFERRWLHRAARPDGNALETSEFSAMTDLYQVVANVHEMKPLPFGWRDLIPLLLAGLLPFVPVALMAVPLKDMIGALTKLLL
jgi:hypothetical protein